MAPFTLPLALRVHPLKELYPRLFRSFAKVFCGDKAQSVRKNTSLSNNRCCLVKHSCLRIVGSIATNQS